MKVIWETCNYKTLWGIVNQLYLTSLDLHLNSWKSSFLKISASFPFCFLAKAFAYGGTNCCQDEMQTLKNGKHSEDNYMDKRTPVGMDYVRSSVIIEVRKYELVIIWKKNYKCLGKSWKLLGS